MYINVKRLHRCTLSFIIYKENSYALFRSFVSYAVTTLVVETDT